MTVKFWQLQELVEPVDIDAHGDGLWEHENDPTEYKIDEGGNEEVLLTFKGFKSKDWQKVAGLEPENAFGFGLSVGIGQTISKLTGNATTEKITKQVEDMLEPFPVNWRNECFPKYRATNNGEGFPSTVSIKPILSRSAKRRLARERKIEREGEKMSMHETVFGNGATNNENEEVDAKAIAEQ